MKKVMVVFGTRPEAIKMCPLVKELYKNKDFRTIVCLTGQHRQMLYQVMDCFQVTADYNLDIMQKNQTLFDITISILTGMKNILEKERPDLVLVHGDTSTTFATALAAFYMQIPVGHVEAGLRTYDLSAPYPEEFNRQAVGITARYHFAPTDTARQNLLREGKREDTIYVTGNTVIDALQTSIRKDYTHPILEWAKGSRLVLMTVHRRESFGEPMYQIFRGIKRVLDEFEDVKVVYPIHLNPVVRDTANAVFGEHKQIKLIEPLDVLDFHNFMNTAELVLTDSGGIQEEAPSLGKPVLVLRNTTERPEGVAAGTLKLVGTEEERVYQEFRRLLTDRAEYDKMSHASNPYGDGTACRQIVEIIKRTL
jgi:UDP-N-acetylglucosamine 2-epimerase (non-hydrolysing)